jgi:pimeloyl-ACP methyl ester carboxylesterase
MTVIGIDDTNCLMATLDVHDAGEGTAVVLLHGLTATHRYVVMGSRSLERSGHRVIAYDARGHGHSEPAEPYDYAALADDLERVLDERGIDRAVLAGASMGAHTLLRFALERPGRAQALVVITPAYDPASFPGDLDRWDALADGLERGGVEGFVEAYGPITGPWAQTTETVLRQRLSLHEHPRAVAQALRQVPRSRPFERLDELAALSLPVTVVASRDEADPGHPLSVGEAYARTIPGARLVVEGAGSSPLAWQGGQLSKVIAEAAA